MTISGRMTSYLHLRKRLTDLSIADQIPEEVRLRIYSDFLFGEFLASYEKIFCFRNEDSRD